MITMKTILHPTDFSETSNHALKYALSFAKEFGATLYILHVVEDRPAVASMDVVHPPSVILWMREAEKEARAELEALAPPEMRDSVPVERLICSEVPFLEIIRCAGQIKADLIVCGTHGRTGIKHLIFGSVAENVVRKAPCPVLSIRHPSHKFEMPA